MKKHHLLLLIVVTGVATIFLKQTYDLNQTESLAREQLKLLRDAARRSSGMTGSTDSGAGSHGRSSPIDSAALVARLDVDPNSEGFDQIRADFFKEFESQIVTAPLSRLKEICALIEKEYPLDQERNMMARHAWIAIMGEASKSDPTWAMAKMEETAAKLKTPVTEVLRTFQHWSEMEGEVMNPAYASALEKWINKAQAEGKVEADHPLVAELRVAIAATQGDTFTAVRQIAQLPYLSQQKAAEEYFATLQTPSERQQALEKFSTTLHQQNFPKLAREMANQQGFDAARDILTHSSLTPENFDMAAAGIAAAKIGPETRARAQWLLENLRSDDTRALAEFAREWTHANHADAAAWIGKLPQGKQRDATLAGFIPAAAATDGATAIDWALTVSDPELRRDLYQEALTKWQEIDAQRANEYRARHPLGSE